jgi:hypothetical protein
MKKSGARWNRTTDLSIIRAGQRAGQAIGMPLDLPVRATTSHAKTVRAISFGHALGTTGVDKVVRIQCPLADEEMRYLRPLGSVGAVHRAEAPAHPAGRTLTSARACEAPRRRLSLRRSSARRGALEASTDYAIRVRPISLQPESISSRRRYQPDDSGGTEWRSELRRNESPPWRDSTRRQPPYLGETSQPRFHAADDHGIP